MSLLEGLIIDKKDKIVFLVGCFASFYINIIGRVYVGELFIFLLYLTKTETRTRLPKELKTLTNLMYLWLTSAVITDLWCHTPFVDMIKGIISILFLIVLVPFVYWALYDKVSRWIVFYLGTIISSQLTYYLITSQTEFGNAEIWRTYSYAPLFSGLAIFLYWKDYKFCSYVVFLFYGIWILFGGSRNLFISSSMTVIILYVVNKFASYSLQKQFLQYRKNTYALILSMIIGIVVIANVYEYLASNGTLGITAYEKYNKQKNSEFGLASGRLEAIMDMDLISKSPIIGYGSFAKDKSNYRLHFYIDHHIPFNSKAFEHDVDSVKNMLPRHSRIGGLWMWHGIGAGIFWIYTLLLIFKVLRTGCFILEPRLMGLCIYTMLIELWNTFFSIMSVRLPLLFMWVYLILIYKQYKELNQNNFIEYVSD